MSSQDYDVLGIDSKVRVPIQSLSPTTLADLTDVQINEPLLDGQILQYIAATGKWTNVDPQIANNDFIEGYTTRSGDGVTTTFTIPHGFGTTPAHILVDPQSPEAEDDFIRTVDDTYITLEYAFPPPLGTDNLSFYYRVS